MISGAAPGARRPRTSGISVRSSPATARLWSLRCTSSCGLPRRRARRTAVVVGLRYVFAGASGEKVGHPGGERQGVYGPSRGL